MAIHRGITRFLNLEEEKEESEGKVTADNQDWLGRCSKLAEGLEKAWTLVQLPKVHRKKSGTPCPVRLVTMRAVRL